MKFKPFCSSTAVLVSIVVLFLVISCSASAEEDTDEKDEYGNSININTGNLTVGALEISPVSSIVEDITFLTQDPEPEMSPLWSADGSQILYLLKKTTWDGQKYYLMEANGSSVKRRSVLKGMQVSFSDMKPGNEKLTATKYQDYQYDIYVIDLKTQIQTAIAKNPLKLERGGYWSPNGKKIVYSQADMGSPYQVWIMDWNGGNRKRIGTSIHVGTEMDWSPDGKKIVYSAIDSKDEPDLWVISPDGTGQEKLTDTSYGEWGPAFSPDGKYLVYTSEESGKPELWLRNMEGSYKVRLTENAEIGWNPSTHWSPDGKKIVFVANKQNGYGGDICVLTLNPEKENIPVPKITEVKLEPSEGVYEREEATITITVKNEGVETEKGSIYLALPNKEEILVKTGTGGKIKTYPEGSILSGKEGNSVTALYPLVELEGDRWEEGEEKTLRVTVRAKKGEEKVEFLLRAAMQSESGNGYETAPEYSEKTDQQGWYVYTYSLDVYSLPDLIIEDVFVEDSRISYTIKNTGSKTSGSSYTRLYINSLTEPVASDRVLLLKPGEARNLAFDYLYETLEDMDTIMVCADGEESIRESNEMNNWKNITHSVEPKPDKLTVEILAPKQNFSFINGIPEIVKARAKDDLGKPVPGTKGCEVQAEFAVEGISPDASITLYDNGFYGDEKANDGIYTNEWIPEMPENTDSKEPCTLRVTAWDFSLGEAEDKVSGNIISPDLTVEKILWVPPEPEPGDQVTFKVTVKNQGAAAAGSCVLECYVNEKFVVNKSVPGLEAGAESEQNFTWTPKEKGKLAVKAAVKCEKTGLENVIGNNEKTVYVTVGTPSSGGGSPSGGGGSSGTSKSSKKGGGGMTTPEPAKNVESKELSQRFIMSGEHVKYEFPKNVTCIIYVEFDPLRTFKKTTATAEMLRGKSALVSKLPPGEIYRNVNIWVGNKGIADKEHIENATIGFKIEKAWIKEKEVNESSICIQRYNNRTWNQLETQKLKEDARYIYFEARTPGFSPFVITSYTEEDAGVEEDAGKGNGIKQEDMNTPVAGKNPFSADRSLVPGGVSGSGEKSGKRIKAFMSIALISCLFLLEWMVTRRHR